MKTLMITALLSVLSLGHLVEAQDGKSLRSKTQMTEQLLASVPTQDQYIEPKFFFSFTEKQLIAMLPISDEYVEIPKLAVENTAVAKAAIIAPITPKVEVKATTNTRRIGDK